MNKNQLANCNEILIRWDLGLAGNYYIDNVNDGIDGFKVLLNQEDTKQMVEIYFPESVWAYRSSDESFRGVLFYDLKNTYGLDFYADWSFFKIENSRYLEWLKNESWGMNDRCYQIHFFIKGINSVLDIVGAEDPQVRFLDQSAKD